VSPPPTSHHRVMITYRQIPFSVNLTTCSSITSLRWTSMPPLSPYKNLLSFALSPQISILRYISVSIHTFFIHSLTYSVVQKPNQKLSNKASPTSIHLSATAKSAIFSNLPKQREPWLRLQQQQLQAHGSSLDLLLQALLQPPSP